MWRTGSGFGFVLVLLLGLPHCSGDAESGPSACSGKGGDSDGDDVCQAIDNCPDIPNAGQRDTDQDGFGDVCDPTPAVCDAHGGDRDNDTICDDFDNCARVVNKNQLDRDFDNLGDACDPHPTRDDSAAAGAPGSSDPGEGGADTGAGGAISGTAGAGSGGTAGAGTGSAGSPSVPDEDECRGKGGDVDKDDWCGLNDNCISVYNPDQSDRDGDGKGDACDKETCDGLDNDGNGVIDDGYKDADKDGVADCVDQCPGQADVDSDQDHVMDCRDKCPGDASNDSDNDGSCDSVDNCPFTANYNQADGDGDGVGDACQADPCDGIDNDGDGLIDENGGKEDGDHDTLCDVVDLCPEDPLNDIDGDGLCGNEDNCAGVPNPSQSDQDEDGAGDACDLDADAACGPSATLGSTPIPTSITLAHAALDPTRTQLLVSVSSQSVSMPNQLLAIDPNTQTIVWSVNVGSNPGRIAVSRDGSLAYVALNGSTSIRVVDLKKRSVCYQFPFYSQRTREGVTVSDFVVLEGQPEVIVASGLRSSQTTIQVLDHGNPRPVEVNAYSSYSQYIEAIDDSRIWAHSAPYSSSVTELHVEPDGIRSSSPVVWSSTYTTSAEFVYAEQLFFLSNGQVIDPAIPRLVATIPATGALTVDEARHEAYFYEYLSSASQIEVFDTRTFTLIRNVAVPLPSLSYSTVNQLIRWGSSGLILRTAGGLKFMTIGI